MLDRLVHSFDLAIGLRPYDRREDLDLEVVVELLEFVAVELCSIVGHDGVGDSVPANDVLVDKLLDLHRRDGRESFCFNTFSEVVKSHYSVLHTTSSFGKSTN